MYVDPQSSAILDFELEKFDMRTEDRKSFLEFCMDCPDWGSPDHASVGSGAKRSSVSSGGRPPSSSPPSRKEFFKKFEDSEILTAKLEGWFAEISEDSSRKEPAFDVPFELTELQKFDYALEGVTFQQLVRMPSAVYASTSDAVEATAFLAIEDFLHASVKGLWETFWGQDEPLPFTVACLHNHNSVSKFYSAEKAIVSGKLAGLCATAIMLKRNRHHSHGKWDHILELALLRPDVGSLSMECDRRPSLSVLGEALFFAVRMLLSRSLSRSSVRQNSNCVFVLVVDSQYGGVVKVEGDLNKLELDVNNVYECAAEWIKNHSQITVSPVDRIWNKLGNANWGDIGALQVLLATFHSIVQFAGMPKLSIEDLASDHSIHLQNRRTERQLAETQVNGNGFFRFQQCSHSPEIVEVQEESVKIEREEMVRMEVGTVLWLEDSNYQKGFMINEVLIDGELPIYGAASVEEPGNPLMLYVGSHPSHLEPAWEDMSLWYQVQRQTKVLTVMKQRGLFSKHLPQLIASGKIIHPGPCRKPSSRSNCDHPWCGTPVLVTSPVGESVVDLVKNGLFDSDEVLKCCHDCLCALSIAGSAGIRHGDIRPDNVIRVSIGARNPYYVVIGWGHAVLEDRDRPAMNLHYSSTFALQEGKLCSASDAESLIYMLYYSTGGAFPDLDSVEGALQWRELSWSRRVIQQKLGDISAVLKAFADYVDSLCGTPYPVNYEIWLRRLRKSFYGDDHGKEIDASAKSVEKCEPLRSSGSISRFSSNVYGASSIFSIPLEHASYYRFVGCGAACYASAFLYEYLKCSEPITEFERASHSSRSKFCYDGLSLFPAYCSTIHPCSRHEAVKKTACASTKEPKSTTALFLPAIQFDALFVVWFGAEFSCFPDEGQ
ncbi:hypothetical protein ACLOJK_024880 [Asimina triloba]